ncbi:hypothetical protein PPL_06984 [Heterostelium album PN500]|uniref:NADH dehydrogenase [ubiquinone] 1 alpha subcomplex subunit 12 n=1 Tax=Heterostelium pallidum (strain ATCC 26659 / Pp 5 / PN500) TaxID=670386 RepID=D3BE31_HETP5|nr:hypothetical protein PPL_06984 [Heterostelium album PN500]EFA80162.1 hypothetical protein PPL_06984 [Heterostelium album PN500]|eukprot:XP_020432282.1 hypothetical protein PPL_06984 [Heterostelium album PN500]
MSGRTAVHHFKNLLDRFNLRSKELVGQDKLSNRYYKHYFEGKEKRTIEFYDGVPNPRIIPVQWSSWLGFRRDDAPSILELEQEEYRQEAIKVKSKKLEEEDKKLRLQEISERDNKDKIY